jgi:succinate dehydrogenase / fumarate reductase cytochrome b subunit
MNSIIEFYRSSIGKKIVMSLTGLFLIVFLMEHCIGNLLLFANDGGVKFEAYGTFLVGNPVIRCIELFLFAFVGFHAILGVFLWFVNRYKRGIGYKKYRLRDNVPVASRTWTIITTGSFIALFLLIHLRSFFWPIRIEGSRVSEYALVLHAFSNPLYDVFYLTAFVLLGVHLKHGFQSAFQTLGLRNKKYTPLIDAAAFLVWFLIPLGFASIPIYFFYYAQIGGR